MIEPTRSALLPWTTVALPLQPCLCDVWHDHVLFEGDGVTGIVDYGSVKLDHPAVDLARLLGSLVGDEATSRAAGMEAYQQVGSRLSPAECRLIETLDRSGTVLGATNWLRWVFHENRQYARLGAVAQRVEALVRRLQAW